MELRLIVDFGKAVEWDDQAEGYTRDNRLTSRSRFEVTFITLVTQFI